MTLLIFVIRCRVVTTPHFFFLKSLVLFLFVSPSDASHLLLCSSMMLRLQSSVLNPARNVYIRNLFSSTSNDKSNNTFRLTKRVSVPPHLLFNVVSDVARYHEFVPFVTRSFINERNEETGMPTKGGFRVGWKNYDEEFVCRLNCIENRRVEAESLTTLLFEYLNNDWSFKPIRSRLSNEMHTAVELTLRFKFKNPLYNTVSSLFQDQVSEIMITAFETRAKELADLNKNLD